MAVRFILMMALMMVSSAHPGPDPDVHIDIKQEVNARCGGGCCDNNCCWFDNNPYKVGFILKTECMELCCQNNGQWKFTGIINDCGNCTVGGEPLVYTFDHVIGKPRPYWTKVNGTYVLTQPGLTKSPRPNFGVYGHFQDITWNPGASCVAGVTYYEPGGVVTAGCTCTFGGSFACRVRVFPGSSFSGVITYFTRSIGPITVFCISIIGTQGLTVVVCERPYYDPLLYNLPWVYIYAQKSLRSTPTATSLYGLCNTYTGQDQPSPAYIEAITGTRLDNPEDPFIDSWECNPLSSCW